MMTVLVWIVSVLAGVLIIKSILFWVYLWQLKEYRPSRFFADYSVRKIVTFWIGGGGRRFARPVITGRAVVTAGGALIGIGLGGVLAWWLGSNGIVSAVVLYVGVPVVVTAGVLITWIPNMVTKHMLLYRLRKKRDALPKMIVIGITGSFGKSSTKEIIASVLSQAFKVTKTPANINSEIGVARFVLSPEFDASAEVFVAEIGAYRPGEIRRVAQALQPNIAILTAVSEQHLALFGSLENTKRAKYELIESLSDDGLAFFSGENENARALSEKWTGKKVLYTTLPEANLSALPSVYYPNVSAAIEVARHLGMSEEAIIQGVRSLTPSGAMLQQHVGVGGATIIRDLYSANPDGVKAALRELGKKPGRKIVIMPCLIELGERATEIHRAIGKMVADMGAEGFITTDDYFEDIQATAGSAVQLAVSPDTVIALAQYIDADTTVLLEGRVSQKIVDAFA